MLRYLIKIPLYTLLMICCLLTACSTHSSLAEQTPITETLASGRTTVLTFSTTSQTKASEQKQTNQDFITSQTSQFSAERRAVPNQQSSDLAKLTPELEQKLVAYVREQLSPVAENYDLAFSEPTTGLGFQLKSERRLRAASSIKVFIMGATYQKIANGELSPEQMIEIAEEDLVGGAGIIAGSGVAKLSVRDLIYDMMVYSDNTASNILIRLNGGFDQLNKYAREKYCLDTHFGRLFMGDSDGDLQENYTTSHDLVYLMSLLVKHELTSPIYDSEMIEIMKQAQATRAFSNLLPATDVLASYAKGGELSNSRSCVNVIETVHGTYVVAGMADNCNNEAVIAAFEKIGTEIYEYYREMRKK